jgi:hypothetical protein
MATRRTVIGDSQVRSPAEQQSECKKNYDEDCTQDIEVDQTSEILIPDSGCTIAHRAVNDEKPRKQAGKKKDLPQFPQFQIFPPLVSNPEPHVSQHSLDPRGFSRKASERHQDDGTKQDLDKHSLSFRLASADDRCQIDG